MLTQQNFKILMSRRPKLLRKIIAALLLDLCAKVRKRNEGMDCEMCDQIPVAVFELTLNGKISYANRTGLSVFGYEESDLAAGINFNAILIDEDKERFVQCLRSIPAQEGRKKGEYSVVTKKGPFSQPQFIVIQSPRTTTFPAGELLFLTFLKGKR